MSREIGSMAKKRRSDFDFSGPIAELPLAVKSLLDGA
jgi:hypothetical protein